MSDQNERLARMEGKMEIFISLMQEIRDDIKKQPSKEDLDSLDRKVEKIETEFKTEINNLKMKDTALTSNQDKLTWKVGAILTAVATIGSIAMQAIIKAITT